MAGAGWGVEEVQAGRGDSGALGAGTPRQPKGRAANELPAREAYYPQAAPTWPLQENVTVPTLTQGSGSLHC